MFRVPRSLLFPRVALFIPILINAVAALLVIGAMMSGGPHTAHAQLDCVGAGEGELCISLDPESASNPVNTDHTLTATVTLGGEPQADETVVIYIFDGPNAEEHLDETPTDANGQASFIYNGDGGPETDSIVGLSCAPGPEQFQICLGVIYALRDCPNPGLDPTCLAEAEDTCWEEEACIFDVATKNWVEPTPTPTPTPEPTPTATPTATPTPEAAPAEELPTTGGAPSDGSSGLPWLAIIAGAIAVTSAGGLWFAHQRRHVR